MLRFFERYQTAIVIFVAIVLPLVVYRANSVDPADANLVDRLAMLASAPLKRLLSAAVTTVSDAWYGYVDLAGARRENGDLRRRALSAERARDELGAMAAENQSLKRMLDIKVKNPGFELVPANVIAAGSSLFSRSLEIDAGSVDGVARGHVVLCDEGLVGTVVRVGWTSSEVMLVADERLSVSVRVARSRARGRVRGSGLVPGFALELTEVLRWDDMREGDRVETSGLGGVFPPGIPVGEVRLVRTPTGAQHRVGDVEPYVDFARVERVSVLVAAPKEQRLVTPEPLRPPSLRGGVVMPSATRDAGRPDAAPTPTRRERADAGARDRGGADGLEEPSEDAAEPGAEEPADAGAPLDAEAQALDAAPDLLDSGAARTSTAGPSP